MLRCAGVLSFYNNHLCCFCFTYFVCRFFVGKDCSTFSCFCCVTFHTFSSSTLPRIDSCLEHAPSLNILKDEILLKMPNVDEDIVDCRSRRKSSKRMHFSGNKNICFLFEFQLTAETQSKSYNLFSSFLNMFGCLGPLFQLRWAHRLHLIQFSQQKNFGTTEKRFEVWSNIQDSISSVVLLFSPSCRAHVNQCTDALTCTDQIKKKKNQTYSFSSKLFRKLLKDTWNKK